MPVRALRSACYVIVTMTGLIWGYLEHFSDRWMVSVLAVYGTVFLALYIHRVTVRHRTRKPTKTPRVSPRNSFHEAP